MEAREVVACPTCRGECLPGAAVCLYCGAALTARCPSCQAAVRPNQRFCSDCGSPLVVRSSTDDHNAPQQWSPSTTRVQSQTPDEERRLVTALFCDLVGFTSASEEHDPEVMREVQTLYFSRMHQELVRYGGTVEKYAGDAVLAFFGVPSTHEDDPERAVLCALSMQAAMKELTREIAQRWGIVTSMRIGINTGDVVSGMWDTGARRDWGVTGDTVNTAARLQTVANPGEVLVGEETMRLARRQIAFGEERRLALKGKADPVRAYPALEPLQRTAERWETGKQRTPLVGRRVDLQRILAIWEEVRGGTGRMVTVMADAGVGKSRLLAEAVERIAHGEVSELRGRCFSYGQGMTLSLVADLVRTLVGLYDGDSPERSGQRLQGRIDTLLPGESDATRLELLNVLRDLLGLSVHSEGSWSAQVRRQTLV
jgi:adenylate cyclase